jgi:hypothetical protein
MVYPLPQPVEPPDDDVFFHKHQLRVGTALRYYGRSNPGALWFVTGIFSTNKGRHIPRAETFPQTLEDLVRLKNHETGEVRFFRFSYISYSSIYRIED